MIFLISADVNLKNIYKFVTMVHQYNYYIFGHYPPSCLYSKYTVIFIFQNPVSETLRLKNKYYDVFR
jgi:hypothetical protein